MCLLYQQDGLSSLRRSSSPLTDPGTPVLDNPLACVSSLSRLFRVSGWPRWMGLRFLHNLRQSQSTQRQGPLTASDIQISNEPASVGKRPSNNDITPMSSSGPWPNSVILSFISLISSSDDGLLQCGRRLQPHQYGCTCISHAPSVAAASRSVLFLTYLGVH